MVILINGLTVRNQLPHTDSYFRCWAFSKFEYYIVIFQFSKNYFYLPYFGQIKFNILKILMFLGNEFSWQKKINSLIFRLFTILGFCMVFGCFVFFLFVWFVLFCIVLFFVLVFCRRFVNVLLALRNVPLENSIDLCHIHAIVFLQQNCLYRQLIFFIIQYFWW